MNIKLYYQNAPSRARLKEVNMSLGLKALDARILNPRLFGCGDEPKDQEEWLTDEQKIIP